MRHSLGTVSFPIMCNINEGLCETFHQLMIYISCNFVAVCSQAAGTKTEVDYDDILFTLRLIYDRVLCQMCEWCGLYCADSASAVI